MASFTPEEAAKFVTEAIQKGKVLMAKLASDIVGISSPALTENQIENKLQSSAKKQICGLKVASGDKKDWYVLDYNKGITTPFTTNNIEEAIFFSDEESAQEYKSTVGGTTNKYVYYDQTESEIYVVGQNGEIEESGYDGPFYLQIASGELRGYYIVEKTKNPLITNILEDIVTWFESTAEAQEFINENEINYKYINGQTSDVIPSLVFSPSSDVDGAVEEMADEFGPDIQAKNASCWSQTTPRPPTQPELVNVIKQVIGKYA